MGQPRATRRKVVTVSSDEADEAVNKAATSDQDAGDEPVKPQKRSTGKLKPVKTINKAQHPTPPASTPNRSSQRSPAKSKASKPSRAKGKAAAKDVPAPNGRTIFSFFNSATQRQRSSQPPASPEKPSISQTEAEIIHDDSEDEKRSMSGLHLARGSSTALAVRKRKVHQEDPSLENEAGLPSPASQKFRKTSGGERVPSLSVVNEDKRPWTDQFAPKDLSELAVHKRKVADVRHWLEMTLRGQRQKALVLKGAAGTGKTTTIRLLAEDMGYEIVEWNNPAGADLTAEGSASTANRFYDFVSRACVSKGLTFSADHDEKLESANGTEGHGQSDSDSQRKLLLVEEFPNTFSRSSSTLQAFRSAILQYLAAPPLPNDTSATPIVMIVSETLLSTNTALADSFTTHRLLGPELLSHPYLDTIEFNAVAPTILTKTLETIVLKEARKSGRRRTPGPLVLKQLAESGDVRSAVSSLEFLCLRGDDGDTWSSKVTFTKSKKGKTEAPLTQAEEEALKLISNRESTLGIFHAVGKVVYNKRTASQFIEQPPSWLPQHRREKVPETVVDDLVDELGTDVSTFVAALHENYALSCSSSSAEDTLDSLLGCIDNISDADLLSIDRFSHGTRAFSGSASDSLRQDEMCFQAAVRGLLFSIPYPVHRSLLAEGKRGDAHRMFYPSSIKLWKKKEEIDGVLDLLTARFQADNPTSDSQMPGSKLQAAAGVENWKRNSSFATQLDERISSEPVGVTTSSAKSEMLIERLPYMSQIMIARSTSSSLLEQISAVVHIGGSVPPDEDGDLEADEDDGDSQEQWTTDRPDHEAHAKRSKTVTKAKQSTKATEGGGLAIPVETRVGKLVLEDDDIVDD